MTLFTHPIRPIVTPRKQRGATTLIVSLILLFGMTLIAFFVNRSMLFEQKTSANQLRSTKAFEAAEAGIEWATAMLNDPRYIDESCTTAGTNTQSFRKKYLLPYNAATGFTPATTARPGCSISTTTGTPVLSCSCPDTPSTNPSLTSTTDATFTVTFDPVDTTTPDNESVLITSYGCTAAGGGDRCVPGNTNNADAYQKISVIVKLRPTVRAVPAAAITTGGSLQLTSAASSITNTDPGSNGILVNAGGGINTTTVPSCNGNGNGEFKDFQNKSTLPGTPWQNSMIANDTSLSTLSTNPDAMFESYFGTTINQFKTDTSTKILPSSGASCTSVERDFYSEFDKGYRSFYTDCDFQTSNNMGSAADPIIFVTTGALKFNGGEKIYGLVYGDQATWDQVGLGNGEINGALIVRGNYCANANANYNYDAEALKNIRGSTGSLVRVPGSWKDF